MDNANTITELSMSSDVTNYTTSGIRTTLFTEPRKLYIFLLVVSVIFSIGMGFMAYILTDNNPIAPLGFLFLVIPIIAILTQLQHNWKPSNGIYLLPIISLALFYLTGTDLFLFVLIAVLALAIALIAFVPLAAYTYDFEIKYNQTLGEVTIVYHKLYCTPSETFNIAPTDTLKLQVLDQPNLFKAGLYHSIITPDGKPHYILPVSVNGFFLINQLIEIFPSATFVFNNISNSNATLILPNIHKVSITVPNEQTSSNYINIDRLPEIQSLSSYRHKRPAWGIFNLLKQLIAIGLALSLAIFIPVLLIISNLGYIERAPIDYQIYLSIMSLLFIAIGSIWTGNFLVLNFGQHSVTLNDKYVTLRYELPFRSYELQYHRSLNPLLSFEKKILFMVILSDDDKIFYKHRLAKVDRDEISTVIDSQFSL